MKFACNDVKLYRMQRIEVIASYTCCALTPLSRYTSLVLTVNLPGRVASIADLSTVLVFPPCLCDRVVLLDNRRKDREGICQLEASVSRLVM